MRTITTWLSVFLLGGWGVWEAPSVERRRSPPTGSVLGSVLGCAFLGPSSFLLRRKSSLIFLTRRVGSAILCFLKKIMQLRWCKSQRCKVGKSFD